MHSASSEGADRVHIFDTTLRDGEQSPGISLNTQEKVEIAQQLARLGVDVIEAGFPITSPGDFEAVQEISRNVEGPVICGLARTHKADIDAAWGAISRRRAAADPHLHLDLRHPHRAPAADDPRRRQGPGPGRGGPGPLLLRRRRVLADGRDPGRHRVHRRGLRDRGGGGGDGRQHPRHGRLHDAGGVRRVLPPPLRAGPRPGRGRDLGPLPRRPRPGGRQLLRRACWRARARSSARSTASASAPATARWRRS